jgi:hypothetical protein
MEKRIYELESLLVNSCWYRVGDNYFCHHCGNSMSLVLDPPDRWKSHKLNCPVFYVANRRNAENAGGVR